MFERVTGFEVFRSPTPGGPYTKLTSKLVVLDGLTDTTLPVGVPSYYVVKSVDTSGNESAPSVEISATPAG